MSNSTPVYSAAAVTAREKARRRKLHKQIAGVVIGLSLVGANVALFVWREEIVAWVRANLGEFEIVIERER